VVRRAEGGLAAILREQIDGLSMSGADLARRIGVGQPTVSKWLTGTALPGVEHLPALAEALGYDLADLTRKVAATKRGGPPVKVEPPTVLRRLDALERWQSWAENVLTSLVEVLPDRDGGPA
jgi:transcriptional regulator with XRE-family HTH domain